MMASQPFFTLLNHTTTHTITENPLPVSILACNDTDMTLPFAAKEFLSLMSIETGLVQRL